MRAMRLAAVLVLTGCTLVNDPASHQGGGGGQDAGTDAGPARVEAVEFCRAYAQLMCRAYLDCCDLAPERSDEVVELCIDTVRTHCTTDFGTLLLDDRTGYDPVLAAQVLDEGNAFVDDCDPDVAGWMFERSGFLRMLAGTVAGGSSCTPRGGWDAEPFDAAALFSCRGAEQACVYIAENDGLCRERQPIDGRCIAHGDCEPGLRCFWASADAPQGTCQPRLGEGQPCLTASDCDSLACRDGMCRERTQFETYCGIAREP